MSVTNISRREAILASIGAVATAAMPSTGDDSTVAWESVGDDDRFRPEHGDCIEHTLHPQTLIPGLTIRIGDGADSARDYGPFFKRKHIKTAIAIFDARVRRGQFVSMWPTAMLVPAERAIDYIDPEDIPVVERGA